MTTTLRPTRGHSAPICPLANNVPGSAVIGGKLWIFGGGKPFANGPAAAPRSAKKGLGAWFKRLLRPDTTNTLQVYDPVTDSWTSGPSLNLQRSFPAGTDVGNTAVAVGGYDGSNTITSVEINVTGGGCASPTPTPTATPSCTPGGTPGPWTIVAPYPLVSNRSAVPAMARSLTQRVALQQPRLPDRMPFTGMIRSPIPGLR